MSDEVANPYADTWEQLATQFESAMRVAPHLRTAYLDAHFEPHSPARAELDALLAAAEHAPTFLNTFAQEIIAPALHTAIADTADVQPGSLVEEIEAHALQGRFVRHYEVRERIGAGGMGVVYRGYDTILERTVALKFVSPARIADPEARTQLLREAQAVSALDDPHVCALHAVENMDDGGVCLVMHYCVGGTLRDRLKQGPLPLAMVLTVARQLAQGLACAHRNEMVHRDFKPANVGFSEGDVAKLLDFGIAARLNSTATTSGNLAFAGTLPYLAPEVIKGAEPDARADVWSFGVTLHEMLTGQRPFVAATDAAMLYAILENEIPIPVRADGEAIPAAVLSLLGRSLQRDPELRFANGTALLDAFSHAHTISNAHLHSQPKPIAAVPAARRSRVPAIAAVAIALSLLLALAAKIWSTRERELGVNATLPLEVAHSGAPLATVAVLPFSVRGDATLEYLREGMIDLLTPAFDATGLFRGIDPNAVLGYNASAFTAQRAPTQFDSANARIAAERLGAQRYVTGSVVHVGDTFVLRAAMHHIDGAESGRAQVVLSDASQLPGGADAIVRQLLAAELSAPGDTLSAVAASTTTSAVALRAFMDGERELRDARPANAVSYFRKAVQADSMFGLAWYRLARAARWSEVDSLSMRAAERAFALSANMPLRLQTVIRAYHNLRAGSPAASERELRAVVADYPTDIDAWMLLGEVLFESNPYRGHPSAEAMLPFQTVMKLDPRNREVTVFLMELAARANQYGALDTLFQMYFRPNSAGEQPGIRQTYLALHARRTQQKLPDRATAARVDDPLNARIALRRIGSDDRDLSAARQFATTMAASSNPPDIRAEGLLALAQLEVAAGRDRDAQVFWSATDSLAPFATLVHRSLSAIAPTLPASNAEMRRLLQALSGRDPRAESTPSQPSAAERFVIVQYLRGVLSLQVGDTASVQEAIDRIVRAPATVSAAGLGASLHGHLALARGACAEAIAFFEDGVIDAPAHFIHTSPVFEQFGDRLAHADALRRLGRYDAANAWYASLRDGPALWGAAYRDISLQRERAVQRPESGSCR